MIAKLAVTSGLRSCLNRGYGYGMVWVWNGLVMGLFCYGYGYGMLLDRDDFWYSFVKLCDLQKPFCGSHFMVIKFNG
jgi:hypothetical protein